MLYEGTVLADLFEEVQLHGAPLLLLRVAFAERAQLFEVAVREQELLLRLPLLKRAHSIQGAVLDST